MINQIAQEVLRQMKAMQGSASVGSASVGGVLLSDMRPDAKVSEIKQKLINFLKNSEINEFLSVNSTNECLPYILSISFDKIKGEVLMHSLEANGILISTGSACSSKKAGNRTLKAMGKTDSDIIGSVRLSFSPYDEYDINYICDAIIKNVLRFEKNNLIKK
jgi:cysteine desulfurase